MKIDYAKKDFLKSDDICSSNIVTTIKGILGLIVLGLFFGYILFEALVRVW